jgi:hypothetical protein
MSLTACSYAVIFSKTSSASGVAVSVGVEVGVSVGAEVGVLVGVDVDVWVFESPEVWHPPRIEIPAAPVACKNLRRV